MKQMVIANISLDIVGIVLSMIPIVYLLGGKRYQQKNNQYFLGVCVSNLFMIAGDLADWILQNPANQNQKNILLIFSMIFYIASAFVLYFFGLYIIEYLKITGVAKKCYLYSVVAVCSIQVFFAVISPFTGSIFYVTNSGYQRGDLFWVSQAVPTFCYLLFSILVIVYRKRLNWREIIFFLLYIFVPFGGGASQMFATDKELLAIAKEVEKNQKYLKTLYENLVLGIIDLPEYKEMKSGYEVKIEQGRQKHFEITSKKESLNQQIGQFDALTNEVNSIHSPKQLNREIIEKLIERIVVKDDNSIDIIFTFQNAFPLVEEVLSNGK